MAEAARAARNRMRFIFTKFFYALLALGLVPLSLSWGWPALRWLTILFDACLVAAAYLDSRASRLPGGLEVTREFGGRFHIGAETEGRLPRAHHTTRALPLKIKDEYPPEVDLRSLARGGAASRGLARRGEGFRVVARLRAGRRVAPHLLERDGAPREVDDEAVPD